MRCFMVTVICIVLPSGTSLTRTFWGPYQIHDIWVDAYYATVHSIYSTVYFLYNTINSCISTDLLLHICMESSREQVLLEYFGEEPANFTDAEMVNYLPEMHAIVRVVKELPSLGENKVAL